MSNNTITPADLAAQAQARKLAEQATAARKDQQRRATVRGRGYTGPLTRADLAAAAHEATRKGVSVAEIVRPRRKR